MCKWGDLREPEWVNPVPSSEKGGVAGSYVLFPGPKKWLGLVWPLGLCLRPLLLMVSGPGGGWEAYVCVNLHFGAQLMGRK